MMRSSKPGRATARPGFFMPTGQRRGTPTEKTELGANAPIAKGYGDKEAAVLASKWTKFAARSDI
jgi:hypothetical protein